MGYDRERRRTPKGKRAHQWRARAKVRVHDGTVVDLARWAATKDAAEQAVRDAIEDRLRGGLTETPLRPGMRFVDAGAYWLTQNDRPESGLSERTRRDYRLAYRRYVDAPGSSLRGLTLAQANDVQRILSALQHIADHHGSQAAKLARTIVSSILGMALRRGVLDGNAARFTGVVKAKAEKVSDRDRRRAMTREERDRAIAVADAKGEGLTNGRTVAKWDTVADVIAFMAGTGCRIGEARVLLWGDVDLATGQVRIRGTKTTGSDRRVNMPGWLLDRLTARRERMAAWSAVEPRGSQVRPTGPYVFGFVPREEVTPHGRRFPGENRPMDQSNLAGAVREVLDAAGLEWAVPHTFRRTVASLLHESGQVPLVRIADQLGHSDPTMTAKVYLGRDLGGDKSDLAALL